MDWTVSLIPPGSPTDQPPPDTAWKATTDDLRPIECLVWGRGTQTLPMQLLVRVGKNPEDAECAAEWDIIPPGLRLPTIEELRSAVDHVAPKGSMFSFGVYPSRGRDADPFELPDGAEWLGVVLPQAGVVEGSDAARRSLILSPGGMDHAN